MQCFFFFFFFQAEDGIRDVAVTGVQTCALPISSDNSRVRFAVMTACGGWVALIVPISGIVTCQSEKISSMNASNSSSHRSHSSTSSTGDCESCVIAWRSGRRSRKGSEKISCSFSSIARLLCPASSSLMCRRDRKSTRLNSSHGYISYAVFCLKKKKKQKDADVRESM